MDGCRRSIDIDGRAVPLLITRHPRARRIRLRVSPADASLILVLPPSVPREAGLAFARQSTAWVREKLADLPMRVSFVAGAVVPVLGIDRTIRHAPDTPARVTLSDAAIIVGGDPVATARLVAAWLRQEARRQIAARVAIQTERLGFPPSPIAIRDPRTRWGSCSVSGRLSFSWRLLLAPEPVLDYVVAHEVAHLVERNHRPGFWRLVTRLMPEAGEARGWLRRHGTTLHRFG